MQLAGQYGQMIQSKKIHQNQFVSLEIILKCKQKVNDLEEERARIIQAQKSLELEKVIQKMKRESYKNELDQCMSMKNQKNNQDQLIMHDLQRQDISNIQQYAQKELGNIAAYRSKLAQKEETIRFRQGQFQAQVMSPEMQREMHIDQVINARNEQFKREQDMKERSERDRKLAMNDDRQRSLERQLEEKRM